MLVSSIGKLNVVKVHIAKSNTTKNGFSGEKKHVQNVNNNTSKTKKKRFSLFA